jgi:RNA polymerase sigma factor (sigma-70 family)
MHIESSFKTTLGVNPTMTTEQYAAAYDRGFSHTRRFIASRGVSVDQAAEIAQTAWARGWEYRQQVRDIEKVGSWVNTIALNVLRTSFRRARTSELCVEGAVTQPTSAQTIDCRKMLELCSPGDRKLLEGFYMAGYTSAELASLHGYTPVAVRVRLFRLRQRLQTALAIKEAL